MSEHVPPPTSDRRHPRVLFGRLQIYAQNHPRGYAIRIFPFLLLLPLVVSLLMTGASGADWSLFPPLLLGTLVPTMSVGVLMIVFMPWLVRRMVGNSTISPNTGSVDLLEGKRQLRRGGLHERDEVNRAARSIVAQAEAKINSPKAFTVIGAIGFVFFTGVAVLTYLGLGPVFGFWVHALFAGLMASYVLFLAPWAKRYRQRARDFVALYDPGRRSTDNSPDGRPVSGTSP